MVDAISNENFDEARETLTHTLAQYMAGKITLTNKDIFENASITEGRYKCLNCDEEFDTTDHSEQMQVDGDLVCPSCGSDNIEPYEYEIED